MALRTSTSRLFRLAARGCSATSRPSQSTGMYSTSSKDQAINDKDYLLGNLPETMRAAVLWEPKKPMTIEDLKLPRPQFGEVLVRTKGIYYMNSIARTLSVHLDDFVLLPDTSQNCGPIKIQCTIMKIQLMVWFCIGNLTSGTCDRQEEHSGKIRKCRLGTAKIASPM